MLSAAAVLPSEASGQALRVNLVDSATAAPLRGALVALIDSDGRPVTEALTSQNGFGNLTAPAGTYRLRVRRIGYQPYMSGPLRVPRADRLTVSVPANPIMLSAVVISARSQCGPITSDASGLGTVWDEVAKALQASRLTMDDLQGVGGGWTYRKTTGSAGEIEATDTSYFTIRNQRPFGAINPAQLAKLGYVEGDETSGWSYYGPDESVLLSPEFAATHCFRVERDRSEPDLIGISFRPIPSRRVPDIAGVAWVDQATSELRRITFRYVNAGLLSRFGGGGETRFQRLPSGAWVVSAWHLRAPITERTGQVARSVGFQENGGGILSPEAFQALRASERSAAVAALAPSASIEGVLLADAKPLAGAEVALTATGHSVRSDSAGRFRFPAVPPGFVHVRARALGFAFADTILTVEKDRRHSIALTLVPVAPTLETVVVEAALPFGKPARYAGTSKFDEFYERRARGRGTFFTLEDVRRAERSRVIDLLGAVPGITVFSPGGVPTIRVARCGANARSGQDDARWLAVFINGQRVGNGLDILSGLHPSGIEAMEVYRGASQLPIEAMGDACAAIFVWTRYTPDDVVDELN
ncbi:MAG: carboxypeptidase regulatory-like domain-containing protein [Gemmatimonadaceae bacterium]|nr:carboxypeptidase regulatory-like domain-containing protein [Gemmatimonadaceae bacterium]